MLYSKHSLCTGKIQEVSWILHLSARGKMKCTPKGKIKKEVPRTSVTMELRPTKSNEGTMGRPKLTIEDHAHHSHFAWDQRIQMQ